MAGILVSEVAQGRSIDDIISAVGCSTTAELNSHDHDVFQFRFALNFSHFY
jgi:hypothetical protein